ncbi:hypothetical protein PX52LOC_04508 [Limnoglobus roseus]|uniref:Uncharacterized protein n=1 Tax=Limnoglobus roseus TaxID=2598579 RepID=A0A5C1AKW2_9BACT|nr:hypothetical protein PX52LOC_04508 [Limnoglobus roseus]
MCRSIPVIVLANISHNSVSPNDPCDDFGRIRVVQVSGKASAISGYNRCKLVFIDESEGAVLSSCYV